MTLTETQRKCYDNAIMGMGAHVAPHGPTCDSAYECCLLELESQLLGVEFSDEPIGICPALAAYGRVLNDTLFADYLDELKPLAIEMLDAIDNPATRQKRSFLFADYAVRVFAPIALDAAGLKAEASKLRALPEIVDRDSAHSAADSAADSARSARSADSAADSAHSADSAARSAADSARSAHSADSARSACSAADSARSAADSKHAEVRALALELYRKANAIDA
jgi:hypothetical protein